MQPKLLHGLGYFGRSIVAAWSMHRYIEVAGDLIYPMRTVNTYRYIGMERTPKSAKRGSMRYSVMKAHKDGSRVVGQDQVACGRTCKAGSKKGK